MAHAWAEWLTQALDWIRSAGPTGSIWFLVLYVALCILFLPGSLLTVGAGAIYGWGWGTLLVAVGSTLGSVINFFTSRYFARNWIEKKLERRPKFRSLAHAIGIEGWPLILLSRLSPIAPHSLVSYAAGLTRIDAKAFIISSFIGFIPLSAAYAYAGALLGKVAAVKSGNAEADSLSWAVWIGGLVMTVVVSFLGLRLAAKAFRNAEALEARQAAQSPKQAG
jgi:uncharacterized membrane protein YdjX (TVP38/TMEM64 family)